MNLCHSGTGGVGGEQKELLDFWIPIPYYSYVNYSFWKIRSESFQHQKC